MPLSTTSTKGENFGNFLFASLYEEIFQYKAWKVILEKDFFPAEKGSASKIAELIVLKVYPFDFCINFTVFLHCSNPFFTR